MQYFTNIIHLVSICSTHWNTFLSHALRTLGCAIQIFEHISVLTAQIPDGRNIRVIRILTQKGQQCIQKHYYK
jgi:hypothetical protein